MATSELGRLLNLRGDVRLDFIDAPTLAENPLGDPATRALAIYLPPGYDPAGDLRLPVIYVLPGYTGDVAAMVSARPWNVNVVQWADRLIESGAMPPTMLALVDGNTRLGGSQYVDSVHNGAYATYVVRDVVGHVDATYPTIATEGGRALVGKSSGGFGAMHLTMTRPGTFCAFASHSGDANFRGAYVPELARTQRVLERHERDPERFVRTFEADLDPTGDDVTVMMMLGQAAAYSPTAGCPFAFDLPLDLETGELREDVFDRWLAFDPAEMCLHKLAELGRLRLRYLDCGRSDEYALDIGARIFTKRVRAMDLEVRHEEFDGGHRNVGYRYAVSLPALAQVLDR